ncbi:Transcription factor ORG2 [Morus notabilis]|uniref:Transcription factor ORG2 n=1 Tax=Morus notabilis TaxID=981085 RepID=W9RZX0_9ROSA|nr:Transcription factor ORG2 [Morus notabilis]
MLALSPTLFSTNVPYWPLEEPVGHDNQNYLYRDISEPANSDQSVFLNSFPTPPPSDQRSRAELDCLATPTTTKAISSDLIMVVKKLNHNASERDRRKKINHLYSSLRALLPASDHTEEKDDLNRSVTIMATEEYLYISFYLNKKMSIPGTVSRVLKYIPELQQEVEGLIQKREALLSMTKSKQQENLQVHQEINYQTKSTTRTPLSSVSASQLNNKEVLLQISAFKLNKDPLSEILHNLEEDGLSVLNASSFESFDGRIFYNLHLQVEGPYNVECGTLGGKFVSLYDDKKELLL